MGGVDLILAIMGCPSISYLNTTDRKMSLYNVALPNLVLNIDKDAPKWLVDLLKGMGSMKAVRNEIKLYDTEVKKC